MTEHDPTMDISDAMRAEARQNPGGWVYVISGNFGTSDAVPPHAVVGAWKVDDAGEIVTGSFQKNPNFKPSPV